MDLRAAEGILAAEDILVAEGIHVAEDWLSGAVEVAGILVAVVVVVR